VDQTTSTGDPGTTDHAPRSSALESDPNAAFTPGLHPTLGFISPVVAKIAQEHHIDLFQVSGTGLNQRITKQDILGYLHHETEAKPLVPTSPRANVGDIQASDSFLPHTSIRRQIADHMVLSRQTSPHVTTVFEADLSKVVSHRNVHKEAYARDGIKLTYTAYFVFATANALKEHPRVNASWHPDGLIFHKDINIGVAVALGEEGLIVPVLKRADDLSLQGIARSVNDLAQRARAKSLQPEEVRDGTFTITNHGVFGSLFAMPIINQPQSAILGVGKMQKRVLVLEDNSGYDTISVRPMVYLTLTFDHRTLDGAAADKFLAMIVQTLENWQ
jgi:2-oxoglutarate dehydrogenase E2 component (dihydrolipoamide succinyltransferase)